MAFETALKQAQSGDPLAIANVGKSYRDGLGVAQNLAEAFHWFTLGWSQHNIDAGNGLAFMHFNGQFVEQSYEKARDIYIQTAELGSLGALGNLGWMHQKGHGVPVDANLAQSYMHKAATRGHCPSQLRLGLLMRTNAELRPLCDKSAFDWIKIAAEAQNAAAAFMTGVMLENGELTQQDRTGAKMWFERAAALGSKPAQNKLKKLDQPDLA